MTTVSRGEITITNVNDGETSHVHTAYAWSADGTDRFTKVYPNENLFLVKEWEKLPERPNPQFISLLEIQLEPSTNYTLSTNIPNWADNTTCDLFLLDSKAEPSSTINGVAINKPRTIKTLTDGIIVIGCRNYEFSSGTHWVKLEKGSTPTIYTPSPKEDYENAYPTYLGTYSSFEEESSLSPYDYTWSLIKGLDGRTPYFHTAYINNTDFGTYDYSGNPNLMRVIKASDFKTESDSDITVSDIGYNSIRLASQGIELKSFAAYTLNNVSSLVSGKTYTISAKVKIEEGTTGNIDKLRIAYRKTLGGTILLSANTKGAEVGKEIIIKGTGIVNYEITDLNRFYLSIGTEAGSKLNGSVIVSDIKIEEGSEATPYQPNLLDAPWYFSTVPLGENIANKDIQFPIKTSEYLAYIARMTEPFIVGETYTITIKATKPASQTFMVYNSGVSDTYYGNLKPVEGLTDVWSLTFTPKNVSSSNPSDLRIFQYPSSTKGAVQIDWLKIEKGNTRTPNIDSYKYLGNYTDFEQADSLKPTKYAWSLIKGVDGETSYMHTAYSWSADGTDKFTTIYPRENYARNSQMELEVIDFNENQAIRELGTPYKLNELIGKTVIISAYVEITNIRARDGGMTTRMGAEIRLLRSSGSYTYIGVWEPLGNKLGQSIAKKRISAKISVPADVVPNSNETLKLYIQANCDYAKVSEVKLEPIETTATVPTIYTPAPSEDYENAYPTYTGTYSDFNIEGSDNPKDYTWARSIGSTGESAKTLILSTSSNTVKINQDSSIQSDTITLQANMQNMAGTATFSATPYIGATPQTAITLGGTGNTRTFSTSSWNKNWTSLVVTATFESFIDKQTIISVKEGKDGADSITGLLTNESVTLPADKNGTIESFSEASGTFKVFDGLSDVTGRNVVYTLKNKSGGTFNINASTGVYNMTEMNKDSAIAVFEATYKNIKIEKILSVAKSKAGKETYTYTKYSNSKDFGNYDYSGNPNLMTVLKASDFLTQSGATIEDFNGGLKVTFTKTDGATFLESRKNIPALLPNKQYTLSADVTVSDGYTGKLDNLRLGYRKFPNGTIILPLTAKDAQVGKKTKIFITANSSSATDPSIFGRMYFTINTTSTEPFVGTVLIENIKVEEGSTATPYQPNLLDEPYWLGNTSLNENIADPVKTFPIKTSSYNIYLGKNTEKYQLNQTYTITMKATKPATQQFGVYLLGGSLGVGNMQPVEGLTDVWELTFKVTQAHLDAGISDLLSMYQLPQSTIGAVTVDWIKLEKGDIRTPNIDSYKYMGVYVGGESEQPHNPTQYAWSQIKGNDSTAYSLLLSSQVMSLPRGASKLVPENVTISGMAQTGEKSIENIKSRIVVEETTNGTTWTTKYDADALTYTYTPSSLNVLSARVKMYVAGAKNIQLDQKSINIVKDGSNGSNGSSSYTWVRYSENANGNPMTTTSNSKTKYIGIAITQTSTAPSSYSDYTWSRIKGSGGLVAKVYSNGGTNIEQSPIQINVETQSDGDIVEPDKVTWYMSKDSSVEWTAITAGNGITLNKKYIIVEPVVFLEANSISFKAQVEYNSMAAFDYMTVNNKSFDATKPLILRQPAAPLNPYPGLLWLDTSSGSGDPLDKTNPSLVYRWGKSAIESVIGTEYAHYAYANTPTGYQEDGVTPDPDFSVTYNSSQKPMYIGYCVTDTEPDPTTPSSYNWKSITTENGSEDVNGARGIAQEKTETAYKWGWVVLSASDLKMLPWLNNEDGSTIIDWIYQITQKTSDDSIIQTVVGSEDMSKVYAKTDAVDELSSANHELSDKLEEYNKQMQESFAGIDTTYVNKSEFEQEMNKFNFGIDKAGGVNLIRNSTGFQWEDTAPSDEMLTNPKFEGTISTTGLNNGWVYNATGIGQVIGAESDFPENKIMRIGGTNSPTKYSYSKNVPVSPGQLINISGQVRIPNTIGDTKNAYLSIRFYAAGSDPSFNAASQTIGNGQGVITLFTDKTNFAGTVFGTDSYTVKTNNIVQDIWSNYSVNVTIPPGAAFMKVLLYNDSTTPTNYFDFRKPSVVLYSGMFDFWHKNDSANAQIRQILGDESLEELGLIAGFELKGLRYKLDQDILLPNPNTEYTLSWYANKISQSGTSKYYVKVLNTKTGAEIAVSEASADTIGYQRMSVTFSVTNTSVVTIRIGLEGEGSADATLSAAGLMINIGPYPLSWQSHHEEVYSTNVRIDSSGLKVFNSDYDGYNVMTPREFAGYYRNGEVYERVFTLNKDTTKVKKLEAQERFMMKPVQIVSVDSPTIQGWAFVGYNGEDTD